METALFVKDVSDKFKETAEVYMLSKPIKYDYNWDTGENSKTSDYVVVSAVSNCYDTGKAETYIFPSDKEGNVLNWMELNGSYRGDTDIEKALKGAGYKSEG